MKRMGIAFILVFLMVFSMVPTCASASEFNLFDLPSIEPAPEEVFSSGPFQYRILQDGTAEIVHCRFPEEQVSALTTLQISIPQQLDGIQVTSIGESAFESVVPPLVELSIPEGIVSIEDFAFMGNSSLTDVVLPDGLERIGTLAFSGCGLKRIWIPESVTDIGIFAWDSSSKIRVVVKEGSYAEQYCQQNGIKYKIAKRGWDREASAQIAAGMVSLASGLVIWILIIISIVKKNEKERKKEEQNPLNRYKKWYESAVREGKTILDPEFKAIGKAILEEYNFDYRYMQETDAYDLFEKCCVPRCLEEQWHREWYEKKKNEFFRKVENGESAWAEYRWISCSISYSYLDPDTLSRITTTTVRNAAKIGKKEALIYLRDLADTISVPSRVKQLSEEQRLAVANSLQEGIEKIEAMPD